MNSAQKVTQTRSLRRKRDPPRKSTTHTGRNNSIGERVELPLKSATSFRKRKRKPFHISLSRPIRMEDCGRN